MWFIGGAWMGGLLSGSIVGAGALAIASPPQWLALILLGATAVLVLLRDGGLVAIPFPQNARQVRQSVLRMHPSSGALMFGFELGTGVRTHMTAVAPYIIVVAVLTAGADLSAGVLAGTGFGLGRGLVPLGRMVHHSGEAWDDWVRRHGERKLPVAAAVGAAVVAAVMILR